MKKVFLNIFLSALTISAISLSSCKKPSGGSDSGSGSGLTIKKGTVVGVVKDGKGNPIPGATVRIETGWNYYDAVTNPRGEYEVYVKDALGGSYKAVAWANISYLGQTYTLRMGMPNLDDYNFFNPANGARRDFVHKISGQIPGQNTTGALGYFGLAIELVNDGNIYDGLVVSPGETIDIILDPIGPLMDGSTGNRVERAITVPPLGESMYLTDVPAGKYQLTAFVDRYGAWQPLKVSGPSETAAAYMEIVPKPGTYGIGTYEAGFARGVVYLRH